MSNRVIKFRAWWDDGKRSLMLRPGDDNCGSDLACCKFLEDGQPVTLMQFTGLLDRDGKEIYEGDILSIPTSFDVPVRIEFNVLGHICAVTERGQSSLLIGEIERCEVIGNIHENPELLEAKQCQ